MAVRATADGALIVSRNCRSQDSPEHRATTVYELTRPYRRRKFGSRASRVADLKTERDKFRFFVNDMIDDLEEMRASLGKHEVTLQQRQEDVDRDEARLKDAIRSLEDRAASCAAQQQELDLKVVEVDALRKEINELQKQRDDARQRLDEAVDELSSMADMLDLLHTTQEDLDRARQELEATRNDTNQSGGPTAEEMEELQQKNQQLARDFRIPNAAPKR